MRVTTIWATHTGIGFHRWPGAPEGRGYLRERHRHAFHVRAEVEVSHADRDVEFHDLQDLIRLWWGPAAREWGASSCEEIAQGVIDQLEGDGYRVASVTVAEDGENGATVRVLP